MYLINLLHIARNNLLDESMHKVSSGNVNKIYSHEEALTNSSHAHRHSSERHHPLGLLGRKDSVDGGTIIPEVGQKNTNKTRNNLANVASMDSNPIQRRGDDEVSYSEFGVWFINLFLFSFYLCRCVEQIHHL